MIRLSDLQLDLMQILWQRGEATTTDVHQALEERLGLAYTTVATLLKRLEDKGAVARRREGRQFVYFPAVRASDVRRGMVDNVIDRLFRGDPAALVNHLLGDERVGPDELERIRAMLKDSERKS